MVISYSYEPLLEFVVVQRKVFGYFEQIAFEITTVKQCQHQMRMMKQTLGIFQSEHIFTHH